MVRKINTSKKDVKKMQEIIIDPTTVTTNFFDFSKVVIQKPWGYEYLIYSNSHCAVWLLYIKPGFQTSMHAHPNKKTSIVLLSGQATLKTLLKDYHLDVCHGLLVDKGVFHSTSVTSDKGIFIMETETPTNKMDLVRLEDKYGRSGEGYESEKFYSDIDDNIHHSFYRTKNPFGVEKKFGNCNLSLIKFSGSDHLKTHLSIFEEGILALLKGNITSSKDNTFLETGDIISVNGVKNMQNITVSEENEFLFVRKQ